MNASESPRSVAYVPPPHGGEWRRAEDGETGLDPVKVTEAVSFAATFETPWSRDLSTVIGGRQRYPSAPAHGYSANGAGGNITWIDPESELVAAVRWIDPAKIDGFLGRLMAALPRRR